MGATNKKSKKSAGFAKRKRQTKRPLQRTGKHKKSAPHVKNLAALVSKDKGDRRAIAIECAGTPGIGCEAAACTGTCVSASEEATCGPEPSVNCAPGGRW